MPDEFFSRKQISERLRARLRPAGRQTTPVDNLMEAARKRRNGHNGK